ncbi:Aste57867_24116 [Aphanomyces stellatus]|uniref:Aste57867_24116 protein n=1 Tax=Aphanomyces stellatus TaxID=120398 RepID=A0A485LPM6_9STRA|nr:hypothetical protein As57867_024042 [Aphanomyces stellatus]VFU00758.1 Aste57867_24116 [Aphanomyces stellatus]
MTDVEQWTAQADALLAKFTPWVGKTLRPSREGNEQDKTTSIVYESEINHTPYRVITNGYIEDLHFTRLNLHVDAARKITRVWVG